ncbi:MAG: TIGR04255 family protein [Bradyrhizobium sp.]
MTDQPYKRPPITEAIIQISFPDPLGADELQKANIALRHHYPHHRNIRNVNVAVTLPPAPQAVPSAQVRPVEEGHRRHSDDQAEIVVLWPRSFLVSQLAPYPGWSELMARFRRDWTTWKKAVTYRRVGRIGVRYVNRIDIPVAGQIVEYEDYLRVYPQVPQEFGPNQAYVVQVRFPMPTLGCNLMINSFPVASPRIGHASYVLDQDIAREVDVPQNNEDLYKMLEDIHLKKNEVFEACITDRARELFRT